MNRNFLSYKDISIILNEWDKLSIEDQNNKGEETHKALENCFGKDMKPYILALGLIEITINTTWHMLKKQKKKINKFILMQYLIIYINGYYICIQNLLERFKRKNWQAPEIVFPESFLDNQGEQSMRKIRDVFAHPNRLSDENIKDVMDYPKRFGGIDQIVKEREIFNKKYMPILGAALSKNSNNSLSQSQNGKNGI